MAAIDRSKLKRSTANLLTLCDTPERFLSEFHNVLRIFSEKSLMISSINGQGVPLKTYHVPKQVMSLISRKIEPIVKQSPGDMLKLCDYMWVDDVLESKILALYILGRISIDFTAEITSRMLKWEKSCRDPHLITHFCNSGLNNLRHYSVSDFLRLSENWITSKSESTQKIGINCMRVLFDDTKFDNLPVTFRLITIVSMNYSLQIEADLYKLLELLLINFPDETSNYLKNLTTTSKNEKVKRLIRQCIVNTSKKTRGY